MSAPRAALAIPHAAWLPERAAMMAELRESLGIAAGASTRSWPSADVAVFAEREHWTGWFLRILRWGARSESASHLVVLQDDVEIAPSFWPSLHAMLTAWPTDVVSLAATHSLGPEVARQGRRSYRTAKIVGWGWAMPLPLVDELLAFAEGGGLADFRAAMPRDGEDTFTAGWLASIGVVPRCPVPTIVDHRMCASTNEGFDSHTHRRSTVTWRGYAAEDMATPGWWQTTAETLPPDDWRRCWWCGARPEIARSAVTGALICGTCVTGLVGSRCGVTMRAG